MRRKNTAALFIVFVFALLLPACALQEARRVHEENLRRHETRRAEISVRTKELTAEGERFVIAFKEFRYKLSNAQAEALVQFERLQNEESRLAYLRSLDSEQLQAGVDLGTWATRWLEEVGKHNAEIDASNREDESLTAEGERLGEEERDRQELANALGAAIASGGQAFARAQHDAAIQLKLDQILLNQRLYGR